MLIYSIKHAASHAPPSTRRASERKVPTLPRTTHRTEMVVLWSDMEAHAHFLTKIGLSDKEAAVYLALLEIGRASAQELATQSKVKRGTVYTILASLLRRGLVSTAQENVGVKGGKQMFYAEDPSNIAELLTEQEHELARTKTEAETHIADLRRLHLSRGTRPVVRYFEGAETRKVTKDISKTKHEHNLTFNNIDALLRAYPGLYHTPEGKRIIDAHTRVLYTSKYGPVQGVHNLALQREGRWVSLEQGPDFAGDVTVYGNKVSFSSFKGTLVSVIIEHEDIARLVEALFNVAWNAVQNTPEPKSTVSLEDIDKM